MKRVSIIFVSLLFIPILVSCPLQFTSDDFLGKRIINYPFWINELNTEFQLSSSEQTLAYSPWMNWQEEGKELSWMPYSFKEINSNFKNMNQYYGISMVDFYKNRENPQEFEFRYSLKTLYCLEGITLRNIDESRRAISFYLEDRKESDFADYFELVIGDERPYKDNSNQEWSFGQLSNGMLTFYKEQENGNDLVVRQFDKNQVQFAFDEFQSYIKR